MAAMLHGRNNRLFFLWENFFFLMQNIFIVPVMQHGGRAKPLFVEIPRVDEVLNYDMKKLILSWRPGMSLLTEPREPWGQGDINLSPIIMKRER